VDEQEIGRIQARQFQALLPKGGGVLFIQGPPNSDTAVSRFEGLKEGLKGSRVELKTVLNGDWSAGSAEAAVTSWLRLKSSASIEIHLIGSQNDSMAMGARKALLERQVGWAGIRFTGCDGLRDGGQRMVDVRQLAATIVKPTTAGPAVELFARTLQGQPVARDLVLQPRSYPALEDLARQPA
jgi:ABC-type sugar transport system substrate-binding protein